MAREATEIVRVTEETWSDLNTLKEPGDSFNDVIRRLLESRGEGDTGNPKTATAD